MGPTLIRLLPPCVACACISAFAEPIVTSCEVEKVQAALAVCCRSSGVSFQASVVAVDGGGGGAEEQQQQQQQQQQPKKRKSTKTQQEHNKLRIDLVRVQSAFGLPGEEFTVMDANGKSAVVQLQEVMTHQKKDSSKALANFVVIKFVFVGQKVSVKLFSNGYLQILGLASQDEWQPHEAATVLLGLVAECLTESKCGCNVQTILPSPDISVTAATAIHSGVADAGMIFDLSALEAAFRAREIADREAACEALAGVGVNTTEEESRVSRNARNNSLVVRLGAKKGSMLFHATGTIQMMGLRTCPDSLMSMVRQVILDNLHTVRPAALPRKRKGGTATSRGRTSTLSPLLQMNTPSPPAVAEEATTPFPRLSILEMWQQELQQQSQQQAQASSLFSAPPIQFETQVQQQPQQSQYSSDSFVYTPLVFDPPEAEISHQQQCVGRKRSRGEDQPTDHDMSAALEDALSAQGDDVPSGKHACFSVAAALDELAQEMFIATQSDDVAVVIQEMMEPVAATPGPSLPSSSSSSSLGDDASSVSFYSHETFAAMAAPQSPAWHCFESSEEADGWW